VLIAVEDHSQHFGRGAHIATSVATHLAGTLSDSCWVSPNNFLHSSIQVLGNFSQAFVLNRLPSNPSPIVRNVREPLRRAAQRPCDAGPIGASLGIHGHTFVRIEQP
jgi:hypothetical protein